LERHADGLLADWQLCKTDASTNAAIACAAALHGTSPPAALAVPGESTSWQGTLCPSEAFPNLCFDVGVHFDML
jgi:hypothetical protein